MRTAMMAWIVVLAMAILIGGCGGTAGTWSVSAGSNYKTSAFGALWSPDPNGGIGLRVVTDSVVPDDTDENVAAGPQLQFYLGEAVGLALDAVLPGDWDPLKNAPVKIYGMMSFLWETDGGRFIFLPGTQFDLFPDRRIRPCVWLEYLLPETGAGLDEELLTTFGATIRF